MPPPITVSSFSHVVAIGLGEDEVAAFRRQAERVAPGLVLELAPSLDEVGELALFNDGCVLLVPLDAQPLSGIEEVRRLRQRHSPAPVLLLASAASPLDELLVEDLGVVEVLAREGYTAFDVRRALASAAAA